eukprot:2292121-Rhodomonas_salina.1
MRRKQTARGNAGAKERGAQAKNGELRPEALTCRCAGVRDARGCQLCPAAAAPLARPVMLTTRLSLAHARG